MSTSNNHNNKRLEKTTACLPVVYGSVAFYLGKKADEFQTHQWTLYVRGPNNEDLSGVISRVIFTLHASFAQPTRELDHPPFEVTERGWGEFEAQIRIIWKESANEKPTLLTHGIKLYPAANPNAGSGAAALPPVTDMETPVVAESYDEVVFTDPTEIFYKQLLQVSQLEPIKLKETKVQAALGEYSDEQTFLALLEAKKFLEQELVVVKERFQIVDSETKQVDEAIREIQERNKTRKAQAQAQAQQQAQQQQQQQQQRTSTSSKKQKT